VRLIAVFLSTFIALTAAVAQEPLLLIQRTWAENQTNESSDCVQVENDGSYHFEHTPMDLFQPGADKFMLAS
jgi:hypothetical protein